ncbi:MAG: bile acid:sodium symporter family protein [Bacteroidetes bacterium]|jgi:BASS family bile acid:Na+ symporter|nr:bile acid:sodium symporter family protein [Bacteroidota bacterium]
MLQTLKELDTIQLNFSTESLYVLNITLALIMFGVALEIKMKDFKQVVQFPKPVIVGIISQFVLLPLVTTVVAILLRNIITPTMALGMILVASCPGGNISNCITSLAKGNSALSVSLTAFSTLFAIVITPLNFSFWGGVFNDVYNAKAGALIRALEIDGNEMFRTVALLLGIPVILGMIFNHRMPNLTRRIIQPFKIVSIVAFMGMVVFAFANNYEYFVLYIKYIFLIVLIQNFLAFSTGYLFSGYWRVNHKERKTLTIETGIQNSGLALVLLFYPNIFPSDMAIGGMVFIAAWWGIWHILAGLAVAAYWSREKA